MKTQFCILWIVLFALSANAQKTSISTDKPPTIQQLQTDPNVLWIGETYMDYAPDYNSSRSDELTQKKMIKIGFKSRNYNKILKLQLQDVDENDWYSHQLPTILLRSIDGVTCYADAALTKKYTSKQLTQKLAVVDTIITFDPQTFEEIVKEVVQQVNPHAIHSFRMKQLIYYDQKAATLKIIPLAIAPLQKVYDKDGKLNMEPLFWCKPDFFDMLPNLNSTAISYAKRSYRPLTQETITPLKGTQTLGELTLLMLEDVKKSKGKKHLGSVFYTDGAKPLPISEIESIGNSIDTIITFDPNTFEQIVQVVQNQFTAQSIIKVRLIQDWIWNEETKTMGIRFVGFAPIIARVDEKGNFLNSGPLFYRRPDLDQLLTK